MCTISSITFAMSIDCLSIFIVFMSNEKATRKWIMRWRPPQTMICPIQTYSCQEKNKKYERCASSTRILTSIICRCPILYKCIWLNLFHNFIYVHNIVLRDWQYSIVYSMKIPTFDANIVTELNNLIWILFFHKPINIHSVDRTYKKMNKYIHQLKIQMKQHTFYGIVLGK